MKHKIILKSSLKKLPIFGKVAVCLYFSRLTPNCTLLKRLGNAGRAVHVLVTELVHR